MESSFLSFPQSEQVEIFRSILEQTGRSNQAEDIGQLIQCLQSIQTNLADAMDEISYLLEQIQTVEEPDIKARLGRMQEEIQKNMHQFGKQAQAAEAEVIEGIQNAMQNLRKKGVQALDCVFSTTHVSQIGRAHV